MPGAVGVPGPAGDRRGAGALSPEVRDAQVRSLRRKLKVVRRSRGKKVDQIEHLVKQNRALRGEIGDLALRFGAALSAPREIADEKHYGRRAARHAAETIARLEARPAPSSAALPCSGSPGGE